MYLTIVSMPLLSSILSGFFGRKLGVKGSQFITCSLIILTAIFSVLAFAEVGLTSKGVSIYLFRWIDLESLNIFWGFNFDCLTTLMLIPVLFVSYLVHMYSIGYMSHDPHNQRFFSYLSLFTFMMIILITGNNYLLMFVGWEGVGICSYLLVSFWFTRIAANQSSIAAILTNRVGDCFLTIGLFAILWCLGNLDYTTVFSLSPFINESVVIIIGGCLLIGGMAKSAQIGLHIWLPMAMEGPTPVSALIHAATMVTAGVYLLIRSSPLIEYSTTVLLLCLWIGAVTTLTSSLIGLFQQDIKKVIAYSTMSQLGLMVIAIGLSSYNIALFHLINHAFYKALLFLGAGSVIHGVIDNQDFRKYGGLKQFMPLSYSVMMIASLSLVAFPFMTGFFSKDTILESCYAKWNLSSITVYYMAIIGAMFTTLYSVKTLHLTFLSNPNTSLFNYRNIHEGNIYMSLPLVILALFSVNFGFFGKDMFVGLGSNIFEDNSVFIHPINEITLNTEFAVPTLYKLLPFTLTIFLVLLSWTLSEYLFNFLVWFKFTRLGYNIFSFFNLRLLIELIYNKYIIEIILKLGGHTTKVLDKGAIELIGPHGLQNSTLYLSKNLTSLDTGIVTTYAVYILMGGLMYALYINISPISDGMLLILILSIGYNRITPRITEIKLNPEYANNILKSQINYLYIIRRIVKTVLIAIILWCIKEMAIPIIDLYREDLRDYSLIIGFSVFLSLVFEYFSPTPLCLGDKEQYIPNKKDGKISNVVFRVANDNPQDRPILETPPRTGLPPVHPLAQHVLNRARANPGTLVGSVQGDRTALNVASNPPVLESNRQNVVTMLPDNLGITNTVYQENRAVYQEVRAYIPNGSDTQEDNPYNRANAYRALARETKQNYDNALRENPGLNVNNEPLNTEAKQWKYTLDIAQSRVYESWGIRNSIAHRDAATARKDDTNNLLITPPFHPSFPERTNDQTR